MRARWWTLLLMAACAPGVESDEQPGGGGDDPTPLEEDGLSTAALEAQLQAAIARSLTIDGAVLQEAYEDAMSMGEMQCPAGGQDFGDFWVDSCTTRGGADFDGYAYAFGGDPQPGASDAYWYVYGEATIADPGGNQLDLGGYGGWGAYDDGGTAWTYHYAYGTFRSGLPEHDDTWLAVDDSVDFYAQVAQQSLTGAKSVYLDGSFGSLLGDRARAVDFMAVELGAMVDPACTDSPRGSIWLRTADADWVEVRFDCDPCGVALLGSEDLGDVCADFSGWTRWEDSPW